jgi:hypothetical protein
VAEDSGRITVSRDALRAELATLELRLVEKLATKAEVDDLGQRVTSLEAKGSPSREEFDRLKGWQARIAGGLALVAVVATAALPIVIGLYFQ